MTETAFNSVVEKQPDPPSVQSQQDRSKAFERSTTVQTFLSVTDTPHPHPHPTNANHALRVRKTPIFSGLLAPFSIVLEVPGLTSKWYAKISPEGLVIRFIPNPTILTVGLSISLTCAVIANLAIILRFLEILRPRQSIALAIAGFALHDLINIVALAVFGGIYGPNNDGLTLSASYWIVCASTITSTLVTASLIADYVQTKDFRHAGSGLTQLQKGLVLAGMGLLLYLSLGSLIFVFVLRVDFITALYFSTATVLTVGFGDVVPTSAGGKVLVVAYAPTGIVLVALVVSTARSAMLETFQAALIERTKETRRRVRETRERLKEEKREERALKKVLPRTFTFDPTAPGDHGFGEALERMENDASHPPSSSSPNTIPGVIAGDPIIQSQIASLSHQLLLSKARTESNFRTYEAHARQEAIIAARLKLILAASVTLTFWLLGAVAFTYAEKWSYGRAMWFCFIAMITIGYGDYHPATQLGRAVFVIWGLMGVAVLTILLAVVQDAFGSIFDRVLTRSTERLFSEKRRKKGMGRRGEEEAVQGLRVGQRRRGKGDRRGRARKSEGDLPNPSLERKEENTIKFIIPPTHKIHLRANTASRMEETLVSNPQKLALAALQTFQHSVRILQLQDHTISQAMCDIPALRHYYNSHQSPIPPSLSENSAALVNLENAIKESANKEYEKVSKLIVANLEFEHHLKVLLGEFQGLKDRVEGFKAHIQSQSQNS